MTHVHQGREQDTPRPDVPQPRTFHRHLPLAAACLAAASILGLIYALVIPPVLAGDGGEYMMMLQSWFEHASPDLRPTDIEALDRVSTGGLPFSELMNPRSGYVETRTGLRYSIHFWLYSLVGLPAKCILHLAGASEFAALQAVNAFLFALAACFAYTQGSGKRSKRLLFLILSMTGPVVWFLRWPHPEVFTWCCVLVSLTLLGRERYGLAAAAAAVGSLQNPPLILLALLPAVLTLLRLQWRRFAGAALGTAPAFVAPLFFLYHYQTASLISTVGGVDFSLLSLGRSWSFFTDLNQGMLPFVPALVISGLAGAVLALAGRRLNGSGVASVLAGMILIIQSAPNWNHGTVGMVRYAVWMMPLFAWLTVEHLPLQRRWLRLLLAAGLILQAGIVFSRTGKPDYLVQQSWSRAVVNIVPAWYNPEPEIFAERQRGDEAIWRDRLPVGFIAADGSITKVLIERKFMRQFAHRFGLEDRLKPGMVRLRHHRDLIYFHPPRGAIKVVEPAGWGKQALHSGISLRAVDLPGAILKPELRFRLELTNTARYRFWGPSSGARHPLTIVCRTSEDNEQLSSSAIHTPFSLSPGETILLPARVELPRHPGTFDIEVQAALRMLVWDDRLIRLRVEALGVDERSYLARVSVAKD
jgi:hypothetical protein